MLVTPHYIGKNLHSGISSYFTEGRFWPLIGIERLHLEQDAGKSIHDLDPSSTFVDLNRSGVALMEIVSRPDLRSPEEVNAYVKKLRSIMKYLGTCDGNMQEGSLRADVNVSVRKEGDKNLGTRCEIKNVNSIKFMQMAIEYEAKRQVELLESGGSINQETRLFDIKKNETRSMRSKEDAHDYRYFPDPDLLPLNLSINLFFFSSGNSGISNLSFSMNSSVTSNGNKSGSGKYL